MASQLEVQANDAQTVVKDLIEVKGQDTTEITESGIKTVEATSNTYVISSGGMYSRGGSVPGSIPQWLDKAVTQAIADGTVSLSQAISDLNTYVHNLENGVNQSIVQLQNEDVRLDGLITTVKTDSDNAIAAINETLVTKITATDAEAISSQVLAAEFDGVASNSGSWVAQQLSTHADEISANTSNVEAAISSITSLDGRHEATAARVDTGYTTVGLNPDGTLNAGAGHFGVIEAKVDGIDARLITQEGVSAGVPPQWDGVSQPKVGEWKKDAGNVYWQYAG